MRKTPWTVAYNLTRKQWMIWSDASPAIAFCWLESDADRIAYLLNRQDAAQRRHGPKREQAA